MFSTEIGIFLSSITIHYILKSSLFSSSLYRVKSIQSSSKKDKNSIVVCTRIHKTSGMSSNYVAIDKVRHFLENLVNCNFLGDTCIDSCVICIGIDEDKAGKTFLFDVRRISERYESSFPGGVHVIHCNPWGKFTHALNVAVNFAIENDYDIIQFMSLETKIDKETIDLLMSYHDNNNTLIVGAALPGHDFKVGMRVLNGVTCPWNTLALWNVKQLALTGFPLVGDGTSSIAGGVEEVSTINLLQMIKGACQANAILVKTPGVDWKVSFDDPKRREWHSKKMASKEIRPRKQMELLGIPDGYVIHVDATTTTS